MTGNVEWDNGVGYAMYSPEHAYFLKAEVERLRALWQTANEGLLESETENTELGHEVERLREERDAALNEGAVLQQKVYLSEAEVERLREERAKGVNYEQGQRNEIDHLHRIEELAWGIIRERSTFAAGSTMDRLRAVLEEKP